MKFSPEKGILFFLINLCLLTLAAAYLLLEVHDDSNMTKNYLCVNKPVLYRSCTTMRERGACPNLHPPSYSG
ncbi:hypothetical protein AVEN_41784-1 [Araneus ventricosus]|uniref:Uncharacterized protein n=1 Tax=Araneus ventricosus TaxID=182803 RepID=A0A4Y2ADJ0_ARAVE|nr:hypothetical protein AVEN_41784-1 [Araneus ventricosus]